MDSPEKILERYQGWLVKTAQRLAFRWHSYSEWPDLVQEGQLAMWKAMSTFDPDKGAEVTYLQRAAHLRMNDCLRRDLWTGQPSVRGHIRESRATPLTSDHIDDLDGQHTPSEYELTSVEWGYHKREIKKALSLLSFEEQVRIRETIMNDGGRYSWRHYRLHEDTRNVLARKLSHLEGVNG